MVLAPTRGVVRRDFIRTPPPGVQASRAYLAWLAVDPVARRRGIGEALLSACARECQTRGWRELATAVHQENEAAQCLYRRLGFEPEPSTAPGLIALRREISSWFGRKALT